jgi:Animal haem peroxidase
VRSCYGKLFPDLPPLGLEIGRLSRLGRRGGICDNGIAAADGGDARGDAAWPIFGQLVAHDLTADRSPIAATRRSAEITNFRTPRADLQWLFGGGPAESPYLYERRDPAKLLLAPSGVDLPRNHEGVALIGDPRNDSHLLISQMHLAFARHHNRTVDDVRGTGCADTELFETARRMTTWHYQHILLREFLPRVVGRSLAEELIEEGPRYFDVGTDGSWIPLEFAAAAYRYGHAQVRQRYQVNARYGPVPLFPDLMGFGPVSPAHAVDWSLLIGAGAQRAKRIGMRLCRALLELPPEVSGVGSEDEYAWPER